VGKKPTAHPAGVVKSHRVGNNQAGVGKTSQRENIAHPAADPVLPTPAKTELKKRGRPSADKRGGWIEFPIKNGKRYPRRRRWKKIDGQWRKVSEGKALELDIMSESEYREYANNRDRARAARRRNRNR
jgi:hypothetical protein